MKTPANTEHSGSNHGNAKPDVMLGGARLEGEADKNDIIANDRKPAARSSSTSTSSTDEKAAYRDQLGVAIQCLDQRPVAQLARAPSVSSPEDLNDIESTSKDFKERNAQAAVVSSLKNPGAQYIPRTAPGFIPSLVQQHQQETLAAFVVTPLEPLHISPEESPRESSIIKNQRTYYVWCAVILACILAVVAVALGVLLRAPGDTHEAIVITQVNPTSFSPIAMNCNFLSDDKQPNVFSQCACNGNVSVVAPDIMERYQNLTNTFVRSVFPQFNEGLHSCSPQNQALLWLASGDGVTTEARIRQRYTLALLFASWDGVNWLSRNKWLSSSDECSWFGLDCNGQGVIVNLNVAENNAIIDLAFMAPLLDHVEALNVSYNTLMDNKIPTEVGLLSKMKILDVTGTGVNGSLPTELFDLGSSLQSFSASYNALSGTISTLIGNLVHLGEYLNPEFLMRHESTLTCSSHFDNH